MISNSIFWREFLVLSSAGVFGGIAVLPYSLTLQGITLRTSRRLCVVIVFQLTQLTILIVVSVAVGLFLGSRTGLGAPVLEQWINGRGAWQSLQVSICSSVLVGAALSVLITILEQAIFAARMPEVRVRPEIPLWQTILACFYGGITEELLTRFGLLTALAWLFGMISNTAESLPSDTAIWTAIIIAAIAFGLGHLPATAGLVPLTPVVVVRALILNGVPGIAFGYLYWTHGLEAAILAHLTTDIMLQVLIAPLYRRFSRR